MASSSEHSSVFAAHSGALGADAGVLADSHLELMAGPGPKRRGAKSSHGPGPKSGGPGPKMGGPGPKSGGPGPKMGGPGPKMGGPGPKSGGPGPKMGGPGPKSGGPGPKMGGPGPKSGGPGPKMGGPGPKSGGPGPKFVASEWLAAGRPSKKHHRRHHRSHHYRAHSRPLPGGGSVLVLDEFLAPQELDRLVRFAAEREPEFVLSEVVAPGAKASGVDFEQRKSRVLYDLDEHEDLISGRILSYLPRILPAVGLDPFPIAQVEAQITASNHGDYFRPHEDNGSPGLETRVLTFVYFFHREPRPFRGGELRIYDPQDGGDGRSRRVHSIVPGQNQLVLFPSHLVHEITPVECRSGRFRDSRFTLNGWFHRPE